MGACDGQDIGDRCLEADAQHGGCCASAGERSGGERTRVSDVPAFSLDSTTPGDRIAFAPPIEPHLRGVYGRKAGNVEGFRLLPCVSEIAQGYGVERRVSGCVNHRSAALGAGRVHVLKAA